MAANCEASISLRSIPRTSAPSAAPVGITWREGAPPISRAASLLAPKTIGILQRHIHRRSGRRTGNLRHGGLIASIDFGFRSGVARLTLVADGFRGTWPPAIVPLARKSAHK